MQSQGSRAAAQEAAEDLFFGQVVIIWARWFVILVAAMLTIWASQSTGELGRRTVLVVVLMAANFFLHGRYLLERPANRALVFALSLLDLVLITAIVLTWSGQVGLASELFVLYYPVLFAFALVFSPRATGSYALVALCAYVLACLVSGSVVVESDVKVLVMRAITLAATCGLGTYYWRIQRERRRAAAARRPTADAA